MWSKRKARRKMRIKDGGGDGGEGGRRSVGWGRWMERVIMSALFTIGGGVHCRLVPPTPFASSSSSDNWSWVALRS